MHHMFRGNGKSGNEAFREMMILITLGLLALFLLILLLLKSADELLIFTGILFSIFIRGLNIKITSQTSV